MTEWRMAGACLVVVGAAGLGMGAAARQKRRLEELRETLRFLLLLKSELLCTGACLADAFGQIAKKMPDVWKEFLGALSEKMQEMETSSFSELWENTCRDCLGGTCLNSGDLIRICGLGKQLGYPDLELQIRLLEMEIEEQEKICGQAADELPAKCRISRSMGLFGGMMLAVMLL